MDSKLIDELNRETPFQELGANITENDSFYKRNHFPSPEISPKDWTLKIEFASKVAAFTLEELNSFDQREVRAVLECAGNTRSSFDVKAEGEFEWGIGAIGSAIWSGVPLRFLFEKSGLSRDLSKVREAIFVGHDGDSEVAAPIESKMRFARGLPIEKALDQDTIVALRMNEKVLPKDHGFPARLIVPGWYAMASVKWLDRIILRKSEEVFHGYFNRTKYVYVTEEKTSTKITPVSELNVKSLATNLVSGQRVAYKTNLTIEGKAWSGYGKIARVEVDFGAGWIDARIIKNDKLGNYEWTGWKAVWTPLERGRGLIRVRATDEAGNIQPETPVPNKYLYGYNAVQKLEVLVD